MRRFVTLGLSSALILIGCSGKPVPAPDTSAGGLAKVLDAARAATKAQGAGNVQAYTPESLHDLVDGQDQYFLDAGFKRLVAEDLKAPDAKGDAYVEFALYDMGTPEGALRVFTGDERSPSLKYLDIGDEAFSSDLGIDMRVGRFYLKLAGRPEPAGQEKFMQALAEAAAKALPPGPSEADLVKPLPAEHLVPHSAQYWPAKFLGLDFLKAVRTAAYTAGGKPVRLFVLDAGDEAKAQALADQWKATPKPAPDVAGPNTFAYKDAYAGEVLVVRQGRFLVGAIGEYMAAKPLVDSVIERLK